jgi:hypothetical protein
LCGSMISGSLAAANAPLILLKNGLHVRLPGGDHPGLVLFGCELAPRVRHQA